jgi:hypothetical protein
MKCRECEGEMDFVGRNIPSICGNSAYLYHCVKCHIIQKGKKPKEEKKE